jgi:hypothetical protein
MSDRPPCIGTEPLFTTVGKAKVYHLARFPNQRYGSFRTQCGKIGWQARTDHEREADLPLCKECGRRVDV